MSEPDLALIVARARNGVIGRDGDLPWRLSSDLKNFKALTLGKPILMGRKTWLSLPRRPLSGRPNLVLSRDADFHADGAEVIAEFSALVMRGKALAAELGCSEAMVIGGASLFERTLPMAARLYVTEVDADVDGDVRFPAFDDAQWEEIEIKSFAAGPNDDFAFVVRTLVRRR